MKCEQCGRPMLNTIDERRCGACGHYSAPPADPGTVEECGSFEVTRVPLSDAEREELSINVRLSDLNRPGPAQDAAPDAPLDEADGWIPVDKKQPDTDRLIWVMEQFGDGGEFTNFESTWGFYRKGKWLSYSHGELGESDHVRFWQEAPVPPARETIQSQ